MLFLYSHAYSHIAQILSNINEHLVFNMLTVLFGVFGEGKEGLFSFVSHLRQSRHLI